ncbi:MAG TPA: hypothetical protein DCG32_06680 [Sphaerochaeta sp.]|jgi:hypothetical protein|nr:hypothetical protein [Sphaerochaeta sp.]
MNQSEKQLMGKAAMVVGVSFVLSRFMLGNFLFTIPLMVLAPKISDRRHALIPVAAVALLTLIVSLFQARGTLSESAGRLLLSIGLFIPLVLLVASAVWIYLDDQRTFVRYLASCAFGMVASIGLVIWLSSGSETVLEVDSIMFESFSALFGQLDGHSGTLSARDLERVYRLSVMVSGFVLVPICMGLVGFASFMAMSYLGRYDDGFSKRVTSWSVPYDTLWVFLGSWTVVLFLMVFKAPYLGRALALNVALGSCVLYAIQGMAIIMHFVRRKGLPISGGRLMMSLFLIAFLVPGLNILVVFLLPLLGVLETWIVFRKDE